MNGKAEKLQDAIGMVDEEYILEAHADETENTVAAETNEAPAAKESMTPIGSRAAKRRKLVASLAVAASMTFAVGVGVLAYSTAMTPSPTPPTGEKNMYMLGEGGADGEAYSPTAMEDSGTAASGATSDAMVAPGPKSPGNIDAEPFVLTGAEYNDNANWPFFINLVNSGAISFPVFGLDPTHRVKATLTDEAGSPVSGKSVTLLDAFGGELWRGTSDKDGNAFLFYRAEQEPVAVSVDGTSHDLTATDDEKRDAQTPTHTQKLDDISITVGSGTAPTGLQVMFIVDTTGSMSDEIAYLQKDFSSIAGEVGNAGGSIEYSVNFYRDSGDEYVTKCNDFTGDVASVQKLIDAEYADGGGDMPEAVAEVLAETITENDAWREGSGKLAFLIFDAPPHEGTDAVLDAAVRSAAERGVRLVPVVASNASRDTELFGRALAIMTGGTYVFLTDDSGVGDSHLEPIVGEYSVEKLHDIIVRIITESM